MIIDRPAPGENTDVGVAKTGRQNNPITQSGYAVKPSQVMTMVDPPPLYDTTPHATSSGNNAFNSTGGDATGPGLFGGPGIFGWRFF